MLGDNVYLKFHYIKLTIVLLNVDLAEIPSDQCIAISDDNLSMPIM